MSCLKVRHHDLLSRLSSVKIMTFIAAGLTSQYSMSLIGVLDITIIGEILML